MTVFPTGPDEVATAPRAGLGNTADGRVAPIVAPVAPAARLYSHHGRVYLEVENASALVLEQVREALRCAAAELPVTIVGPVLTEAVKPAACFGSLAGPESDEPPSLRDAWQANARELLIISLWRVGIRVQRG